ncbi:hypothetical protein [Kinneretia aquatilis]|uniref:hypothetical protein n=1 Tax=Kinneretia aquatilis TaxID=2070761 RepID=UPI000BD60077|nr:hypothetical protein [Paucibacter aquatile]OYU27812.1 MAG: hypothetical protein CFE41_08655 [Burkholderiales bacterium PBB2]WIV96851.1 hypothetical protein K9V56_017715 [Paucibacter aquatile]
MIHARTIRPGLATQFGLALCAWACSASGALALDGIGLQLEKSPWQARVQLSSLEGQGARLLSANLLGDYYLTGSVLGGFSGGLRATGGMLMGAPSASLSSAGLALNRDFRQRLSVGQRSLSLALPDAGMGDAGTSLSYLGIGYSGQSLRGGWGFSADLGLVSSLSLGGLRLGASRNSGAEDLLRDLRLKPVLQFGLSYSY